MLEQFRARMAKEMKESGYTPEPKFTPTFKMSQLSNDDVRELTQNELDYINDECPEVAQELAHESIQ